MTDLPSVLGLYPYESVTHHLQTGRVVFEELVELVPDEQNTHHP
jgi:hypothetical protein